MNLSLVSLNTLKLNKDKIIKISKLKDLNGALVLIRNLNGLKTILKETISITYYTSNLNSLDTHF